MFAAHSTVLASCVAPLPPFNIISSCKSGNGGLIEDAIKAILTGIVDNLVKAVVKPLGTILAGAISAGLKAIGGILVDLTKLQIGASYWAVYSRVIKIAVVIGLVIIFAAVIDGALRGSTKRIVQPVIRVCVGLMASFFLAAVLPLVQGFFTWAASTIAGGVGGVNATGLATKLVAVTGIALTQVELLPLMIAVGIFILLGILLTLVVLIVSVAVVYLMVALFPLMIMLSPTATKKTLELLGVALATPALITLILCLGVAIFADGPTSLAGAITSTVIGAGLFVLAAVAPFILLKLIPSMEQHFTTLHKTHGATAGKAGQHAAGLATGQSFASKVAGGQMSTASGARQSATSGGAAGIAGFIANRIPRRQDRPPDPPPSPHP